MTTKDKNHWKVLCVGLLCLTAAEITALFLGYNGTLLKAFLVIVALAIGLKMPTPKFLQN